MANVELFFKDAGSLALKGVEINEGMTRIVVYQDADTYSVVPLVNLWYYDVAPSTE